MYNTRSFRVFIYFFWITAVIASMVTLIACSADQQPQYQHQDAKLHEECDKAYQDAEYVIDSLCDRITELETVVAGYEHADHSRLVAN